MKITVLSATTTTVPTAKGSYQKLELAFKGEDGKVLGKNIMSFGAAAVTFKVLAKAQGGEVYDITSVKNEASGYWDWTNAAKGEAGSALVASSASPPAVGTTKSTYETSEERARKQVYIVRQSSLSAAINYIGDTKKVSTNDVIAVAKQFEAYVFSTGVSPVVEEFVGDEDQIL